MRFMFLGNLIGFPAIVVPTTLAGNNLPLAVQVPSFAAGAHSQTLHYQLSPIQFPIQFMSAPWQEALLLRIAAALEVEIPKPPVYYDIF